jgi:hypothetical protein
MYIHSYMFLSSHNQIGEVTGVTTNGLTNLKCKSSFTNHNGFISLFACFIHKQRVKLVMIKCSQMFHFKYHVPVSRSNLQGHRGISFYLREITATLQTGNPAYKYKQPHNHVSTKTNFILKFLLNVLKSYNQIEPTKLQTRKAI